MYSYHDCYKILSIESGCDWAGVRKAYKQKIQKWHPDRFADSAKKSSAEDKLKELNRAYEQLSVYYKVHGYLPAQDKPTDVVADNIKAKPSRSRHQPKPAAREPEADKSNNSSFQQHLSKQSSLFSLVVFTVLAFSLYNLINIESPDGRTTHDPDPAHLESDTSSGNFKHSRHDDPTLHAKLKTSNDVIKSHSKEDHSDIKIEYFTIGSSAVDVLRIQGTPDSVVGNIWFYGESSIEFEDGVVKDWKRTAADPLNAHMDL